MKYLGYTIKNEWYEEDEQSIFWAEFVFEGEEENQQYVGESPHYSRRGSDFYCLREDALTIHHKLQTGSNWEDVRKTFRQSW